MQRFCICRCACFVYHLLRNTQDSNSRGSTAGSAAPPSSSAGTTPPALRPAIKHIGCKAWLSTAELYTGHSSSILPGYCRLMEAALLAQDPTNVVKRIQERGLLAQDSALAPAHWGCTACRHAPRGRSGGSTCPANRKTERSETKSTTNYRVSAEPVKTQRVSAKPVKSHTRKSVPCATVGPGHGGSAAPACLLRQHKPARALTCTKSNGAHKGGYLARQPGFGHGSGVTPASTHRRRSPHAAVRRSRTEVPSASCTSATGMLPLWLQAVHLRSSGTCMHTNCECRRESGATSTCPAPHAVRASASLAALMSSVI